jgi:hypothetical protein
MYTDSAIMLSYDAADELNFIEIGGQTDVVWDGIALTGQPLGSVLASLDTKGVQAEFDGDAIFGFRAFGIGLFTSAPDETDEPVEGVSVYPPVADIE